MAHQITKKVTKLIARPVLRTELIWIGKCPQCEIKQESRNIHFVDRLCDECQLKKYSEEKINILGSIIIGLQWNNETDRLDDIAKIILLKPTGEITCIKLWDCDSILKIYEGV